MSGHSHCEQQYTFRDEADGYKASEEIAEGNDLLQGNEQREENDPKQVHHAAHKQQRHQWPAATDAIRAVTKARALANPAHRGESRHVSSQIQTASGTG